MAGEDEKGVLDKISNGISGLFKKGNDALDEGQAWLAKNFLANNSAQQDRCKVCKRGGLAVFPLRYALIPKQLDTEKSLFSFAGTEHEHIKIKGIRAGTRMLREGYLYVYYTSNGIGQPNVWETYVVNHQGELYLRPTSDEVKSFDAEKDACSYKGHCSPRMLYFVIEKPEKCGDVYICFSENPIEKETLKIYQNDAAKRDLRMQKISPKDFAAPVQLTDVAEKVTQFMKNISATFDAKKQTSGNHASTKQEPPKTVGKPAGEKDKKSVKNSPKDIAFASIQNLNCLPEFKQDAGKYIFQEHEQVSNRLGVKALLATYKTGKDHSFDYDKIGQAWESAITGYCSEFPLSYQKDNLIKITTELHKTGQVNNKQVIQPVMIALHDHIGMARELASHRTNLFSKNQNYLADQEEWYDTYRKLLGIEELVYDAVMLSSTEQGKQSHEKTMERHHNNVKKLTQKSLEMPDTPGAARYLKCANEYEALIGYQHMATLAEMESYSKNFIDQPADKQDKKFAELRAKAQKGVEKSAEKSAESKQKQQDYAKKCAQDVKGQVASNINAGVWLAFKNNIEKTSELIANQANQCSIASVKIFANKYFIQQLEDYRRNKTMDSVLFNETMGELFAGLDGTEAGQQKIESWTTTETINDPKNLLWRTFALNNDNALAELTTLVTEARKAKSSALKEDSDTQINNLISNTGKIFVAYKDSIGFQGEKALMHDRNYIRGSQKTTLGIDKFLTAVINPVFKCFKIDKALDSVGLFLIHHLCFLRAGVDHTKSKEVLSALRQHKLHVMPDVYKYICRTRDPNIMASMSRKLSNETVRKMLESAKPETLKGALVDTRLNIVTFMIELGNLAMLAKQLNDELKKTDDNAATITRVIASLSASAMTLASIYLDVTAGGVKLIGDIMADGANDAAALKNASTASAVKNTTKFLGEKLSSFEKRKLLGGVLAGAAGFIGAIYDFADAWAAGSKQKSVGLITLYWCKFAFSGTGTLFTFLQSTTFAPQLLKEAATRAFGASRGASVATGIQNLTRVRLIGMGLGIWFGVFTVGIQITIIRLEEKPFEAWAARTRFGKRGSRDPFKDKGEQDDELAKCLSMLLS